MGKPATYTVKQLARLSGVSVRALHHYDEIGLLRPAFIGENRYRYYGRDELLRLQDILFHRELGVPLQEIAKLLATEGRDRVEILTEHRTLLAEQVERARQLLRTIDRTIAELNGDGTMKDKDLYQGFAPEKQAEYEDWLVEYGGDRMRRSIEHSRVAFGKLSKEQIQAKLEEGSHAEQALVALFKAGNPIDAPEVTPALERHRAWVSAMWGKPCPPASYGGLADLYLAHPDFVARYEALGEGFTGWLAGAMKAYAARMA